MGKWPQARGDSHMTLDLPAYNWASYSVPITTEKPKPLPGHLVPLDRRHRWLYMKTNARGDFRYRCRVCRTWRTVTPFVNMMARKMRDAAHSLDEHLSEMLWR